MLRELIIRNLVIIEHAQLVCGPGLIAITGETGAGKSLLLEALDLLAGGRATADLVGPAGEACELAADLQIDPALAQRISEDSGVPFADGSLVVRRRLRRDGRSQAWVNDMPVSVGGLRSIVTPLLETYAQDRSASLLEPATQLRALDAYGGHLALAAAYAAAHARAQDLLQEQRALAERERERRREQDFVRFQLAEFQALAPRPGEYAELCARQRLLEAAEQWRGLCAEAAAALSDDERAVLRILGRLGRQLAEAPTPTLRAAAESLRAASEAVREAAAHCLQALEELQADPAELAATTARLDAYHELMRKHGDGEEALLAAQRALAARLAELEAWEQRAASLGEAVAAALAERQRLGAELAEARRRAFAGFAEAVHEILATLGMPRARLSLAEQPGEADALGSIGMALHIQTNPGLPAGPLASVVSGGERSRLLLAVAAALAARTLPPVLIFDEIDSGVGGRLGAAIGAALQRLAAQRSVLVITHTAQVAACASVHYAVRKQQGAEATTVIVERLSGSARQRELADMLGGGRAAEEQARALLGAPG